VKNWFQSLLVSDFACKFNLYRYSAALSGWGTAGRAVVGAVQLESS
jgi:hypothetical protein